MKPALPETVPVRRQVPMCDKETSSSVETQQASVEIIASLLLTAERELASFYEAIEKGMARRKRGRPHTIGSKR
jgi:hypothetical protein